VPVVEGSNPFAPTNNSIDEFGLMIDERFNHQSAIINFYVQYCPQSQIQATGVR
jgi:hypothetical protein